MILKTAFIYISIIKFECTVHNLFLQLPSGQKRLRLGLSIVIKDVNFNGIILNVVKIIQLFSFFVFFHH